MTKEEKINNRLKSDYNYLIDAGYDVLGVFLQGSQNYECDYEKSDIDTKAIILPSFIDLILNKNPVSTTHIFDNNEHLDIKDMRLMHSCFLKQNINFVEILFTKYRYMNPMYSDIYQVMFDNNEYIAHYNNYTTINSIVGMIYEKEHALTHRYEGLKDKIDKYGYDNKQLHTILRLKEFLDKYIDGYKYSDCLITSQKDYLVSIKRDYIYSLDEAILLAKDAVEYTKERKERYMENNKLTVNNSKEMMERVTIDVMKRKLTREKECDIIY